MKRGTIDHPKMRALVAALPIGGCRYQAVGILESLWHFTAMYAYRGDVGRYSDAAIAEWIGWKGSPDSLIEPLTSTGWLNRVDGPERLVVHDWAEHCDDAVRIRMKREAAKSEDVGTCSNMLEHVGASRARKALALSSHTQGSEEVQGKPLTSADLPHEWQGLVDPATIATFFRATTTADPKPAMLACWRAAMVDLASRNANPQAIGEALEAYEHADPKFRPRIPEARFLNAEWFLGLVTKYASQSDDVRF